MARRVAFRKKRQNKLGMIIVSAIVTMLLVTLMIKSYSLKEKEAEYTEKEQVLQSQIDEQHERAEKLVEYEKYTKTAKYVEEVAKEKLGLVYEDEILFKSEGK